MTPINRSENDSELSRSVAPTVSAIQDLGTRFQALNQRVDDGGYQECKMSAADAKRWNVEFNYIYPSQKNVIQLRDENGMRPIHANRIEIAGRDCGIATILPHTTEQAEDFYRCILQEKIGVIINVSQLDDFGWLGKFKYWPQSAPKIFGDIMVSRSGAVNTFKLGGRTSQSQANVEIFNIEIASPHQKRLCKFIHFPDWRDGKGISTDTLSGLVVLTETTCKGEKPIIHCANGVGRTGTLFTALALSQTAAKIPKNADLVDQYIVEGRLCRNKDFVENEEQYKTLLDFAGSSIQGQFSQILPDHSSKL